MTTKQPRLQRKHIKEFDTTALLVDGNDRTESSSI